MAKGPTRDPKREAFWRGILTRFGKSGLNVRDFCARQRLSEPSFYAWRRAIQERDAEAKPAFVPLVLRENESERADGIVIEVCAGPRSLTMRLPAALPVGQVAELVHAMMAAQGAAPVESRP
jgi:hypothetical protein